MTKRGDSTRFANGFQDMVDQVFAGCRALRRAPNVEGNARFRWLMSCGHEETHEGIKLRAAEKAGRVLVCVACRPKQARAPRSPRATNQELNARKAARRKELAPGNRGKGSRICSRCAGLSWQVKACDGPKCFKCGLAYAPEPAVKADGQARRSLP